MIAITAPDIYKNSPTSHVIFSVFSDGELVSKSVSYFKNELNANEFVGIVSKEKSIGYEVNLEYGHGRCMSYQFTYRNQSNGS